MTTDATRRDCGNEPPRAATPAAAYVGLFREPHFTVDLPPLDDEDAAPAHIPAPARNPRARG